MFKAVVLILTILITGCATWAEYPNNDAKDFYEIRAELSAQCRDYAQNSYPGYPDRRGVLTNYWYTRAYDQCMESPTLN
jgi:hypothetical protein